MQFKCDAAIYKETFEPVLKAIAEAGGIIEAVGENLNRLHIIELKSDDAVKVLTEEREKLSALEVGAFPDEAEIAEVEEKIRQQLDSIDLPSDVCS